MDVQGHRGARGHLPENTLQQTTSASLDYSHALDFGTIGAELDIARSTPGFADTVTDTRVAVTGTKVE